MSKTDRPCPRPRCDGTISGVSGRCTNPWCTQKGTGNGW